MHRLRRDGGAGPVPSSPLTLKSLLHHKTKTNQSCSDPRHRATGRLTRSRSAALRDRWSWGRRGLVPSTPRSPHASVHSFPQKTKANPAAPTSERREGYRRPAAHPAPLGSSRLQLFQAMALAAAAAATAATAALRSRASLGLSTWSCEQLRASFRCPRLLRAAVANGGLGSAQEAAHWGCHPHSLWPRPWGSSVSPTRPHPRETTGVFAQPSGTCSPLRTQSGLVHRAGNER